MSLDLDKIKKRILYRSTHRGSKEMDNLMSKFVQSIINKLDSNQIIELDNFINLDDNQIIKIKNEIDTNNHKNFNEIEKIFKKFKIN